jgi:hypothetical protein
LPHDIHLVFKHLQFPIIPSLTDCRRNLEQELVGFVDPRINKQPQCLAIPDLLSEIDYLYIVCNGRIFRICIAVIDFTPFSSARNCLPG